MSIMWVSGVEGCGDLNDTSTEIFSGADPNRPEAHAEQLAGGLSARDARLLRAVFAQSGVGVGISDITGRILVVNAAFAGMFGYGVEEFVTTFKAFELTHPDDPSGVWDLYGQLMRGEVERVRVEKPHLHRDGHTIWNRIRACQVVCVSSCARWG